MMKPLPIFLIIASLLPLPSWAAQVIQAAQPEPMQMGRAQSSAVATLALYSVSAASASTTPASTLPAPVSKLNVTAKAPVATNHGGAPVPQAASHASATFASELQEAPLQVVALYRQDDLLNWIEQGRHLKQVQQDRCQLSQDIEARAAVMKIPAYQFLWGDMLAWGVCTTRNAPLGVRYMKEAAEQGLAPALEQLGRYYWQGILVQKDLRRAEILMREAANLGFLPAKMRWVQMLLQGMGSPLDYEDAYSWLHQAVIGDKAQHQKAARLLSQLAQRMPKNALIRAKGTNHLLAK